MRKTARSTLAAASALTLILGGLSMLPQAVTAAEEASAVEKGKQVAFNRKKGNCLACHEIAGGKLAGNVGPALVNMKERYPDKAKLRAQIWDATKANPNTIMPPFGKHKILSEKEIDLVVEFISSL